MPEVFLNGASLFYQDVGSGNPLLFLPGLGAPHGMFRPQAEALAATHRLILPDLRGNGQSGRLEGPIGTVLNRQCDDLAALLDRLEIARAVVVGVSYGGAVALHLALRHSDRVAGLVVVDSFAELRLTQPMEGLLLAGSYLTLWAYYLPAWLLKLLARGFYRGWPTACMLIPELVDGFRPTEAVLQSLAMCRIGPAGELDRIRCPALGIVGGFSGTAVRFMEHAMHAIPGSRLEVVPDSFDPTNLCQPEEFNRLLAEYLRVIPW